MNKNDIKLMSESYSKVNKHIKEDFTPGLPPGPVKHEAGKPIMLTMKERKMLIEMLENDMGAYTEHTPEEEIDGGETSFYETLISKLKGNTPESPKVSSEVYEKPKRTYYAHELYKNTEGKTVPYPSANQ